MTCAANHLCTAFQQQRRSKVLTQNSWLQQCPLCCSWQYEQIHCCGQCTHSQKCLPDRKHVVKNNKLYIFHHTPNKRNHLQYIIYKKIWHWIILTHHTMVKTQTKVVYCVMFILTDPNIILPVGSVLGGVMVLFIICVIVYYIFKVDIVLWFRRAFPILCTNKGNISVQACN